MNEEVGAGKRMEREEGAISFRKRKTGRNWGKPFIWAKKGGRIFQVD